MVTVSALETVTKFTPNGHPIEIKHEVRVEDILDRAGRVIGRRTTRFIVVSANDLFQAQFYSDLEDWVKRSNQQYADLI